MVPRWIGTVAGRVDPYAQGFTTACISDLEYVSIALGGRLKDDANDVIRVIVAGRFATSLHSTHELRRQTAPVRVKVHRLPLLLLKQHVRQVLVPVNCSVTVRVHLHEDLHQAPALHSAHISFMQAVAQAQPHIADIEVYIGPIRRTDRCI